ncbi:hypothetical protein FOMPIDRAFT_1049434 [Fomitopsis schrenkii]|uniref:Uncharacterized protein n=1 Tax=Fomitopsis schrenkii TaxID=2126942 RepID=S8FQV3_FOMSC|nr:hypothetical protein FOMPIDRAFT_1049434 [Fomitopsis schrenkii]
MSSVSASMLDSVYPSAEKIRIFTGHVWNDAGSTVLVFVAVTEVAGTETAGDDDTLEDGGDGGRKVADVEWVRVYADGASQGDVAILKWVFGNLRMWRLPTISDLFTSVSSESHLPVLAILTTCPPAVNQSLPSANTACSPQNSPRRHCNPDHTHRP